MKVKCERLLMFCIVVAISIHRSFQSPNEGDTQKAALKYGEIADQQSPINIIKKKLNDSGIIDVNDPNLTSVEKKQLNKLFEAVEIMLFDYRARQPQTVQNVFRSLRVVERAVKKQLKDGQLSEGLAAKFKWENMPSRQKRLVPSGHAANGDMDMQDDYDYTTD
ncbi:hypothetical protein NE865_15023 [Phthorimaea operculella]|nr:hypothetical protein NE865_15023 [Phthorimaea operculella]